MRPSSALSDKLALRQHMQRYFVPLAVVLLLITFGSTSMFLYSETNERLVITRSEIVGIEYHHALFDLMRKAQRVRTKIFIAERSGKDDPSLVLLADEMNELEKAVDALNPDARQFGLAHEWVLVRHAIQEAEKPVAEEDANQRFIRQTDAISDLMQFMKDVTYKSKLSNDPDEASNYQLVTLTLSIPNVIRILSLIRGKVSGDLATPDHKLDFFEIQRYVSALKSSYADYKYVTDLLNDSPQKTFGPEDGAMKQAVAYIDGVSKKNAPLPTSQEFYDAMLKPLDAFTDKYNGIAQDMQEKLLKRLRKQRNFQLFVLAVLASAFSLSVIFLVVARRNIVQKAEERKLRESEDLFRTAMQYAVIGQALVSTEGKWLKVNKSLCDMLGYTEQELLMIDFQSITHPEDLQKDWDNVMLMLNREIQTYQMEKRYFHKNGDTIWALLNVSLANNTDGTPKYFIAQIQNITEQKTLMADREELIKKLTESNTALERFAYVASHDMQEPIRMITNFSEIISTDYADKIDDDGKEYLRLIVNAGMRLRELVDDLLIYARVGNEAIKPIAFDSESVMKGVLENLQGLISEQKAEVTHDTLPKMSGSPVQFLRLLQNLISNGIKYQPKGNVARIHVGVHDGSSHWHFTVSDNGLGIKPEYTEQIFQPFRRLHAWEQIHGTGLGLSICKKIVEIHGGQINVDSTPGKGSTFHFSISK